MLAQNDVLEMTKRGVPGVWTYGFYDGWVPNYMIFIAHSHNAIGRFYEVQGYGPDPYDVRPAPTALSREWFRPNPPLPFIRWGPRNNTNIQQSAVLFSLRHVAKNRQLYLENYWLKNKRAVEKGSNGPVHAWVDPRGAAPQGRRRDRGERSAPPGPRDLARDRGVPRRRRRRPGAATSSCAAISRSGRSPRCISRFRTTRRRIRRRTTTPGWTFQLMRDIRIVPVTDKARARPEDDARGRGRQGAPAASRAPGRVLVVEHTADTALVTFRFRHAGVRMLAAEEDFEAAGRKFRAGSIVVPDADRARARADRSRSSACRRGRSAPVPEVQTHELDLPRIGYVHSWTRTQDEGLVAGRARPYGIPYTYFADQKLREGNLRAKYDVILFPHVGGSAVVTGQRHGADRERAAAVQEDRRDAEPRRPRLERRHSRRHGTRRSRRAGEVRPGGRHADHRGIDRDDLSRVRARRRT